MVVVTLDSKRIDITISILFIMDSTAIISFEALAFIGIHGRSGLTLRDLVFFVEYASIASKPHITAISKHSLEIFEASRVEIVKKVVRAVCDNEKGVRLLKSPEIFLPKGLVLNGSFPPSFFDKVFAESNVKFFSEIVVAPTDALRQQILGFPREQITAAATDLLVHICESKGEGIRRVDVHKIMPGNAHHQAIIDLESNMHIAECSRIINVEKSVCEERYYLKYLSFRESYNRVARLKSHRWEDIIHECAGMSPSFVLQQKIKWAFSVLVVLNRKIGNRYIELTDVEDAKVRVPYFMCMDDCMPYAPSALQKRHLHVSSLSQLFHESMFMCYQTHVSGAAIMKSIRKAFQAQLPNVGIEVVAAPVSVWKRLIEDSNQELDVEEAEDELERTLKTGRDGFRLLCTFPNHPALQRIGTNTNDLESADETALRDFTEKYGRSAIQIVENQNKVVAFDLRRPINSQLAETAYYTRPLSATSFVPDVRRGEKKHGIVRWWKLLTLYPSAEVERRIVRESGSKATDQQIDKVSRNNLLPVRMPRFVQFNFKRSRTTQFDDNGQWEDDVADEEAEEEADDEFWITTPKETIESFAHAQQVPMLPDTAAPSYDPLSSVAISNSDGHNERTTASSLPTVSTQEARTSEPKYMTITPILEETDEDLGKRLLKYIADNTLIPGKHVVTTEQLSVVFYRKHIERALAYLKSQVPPAVATTSIRGANKKLVGAIYYGDETFEDNEISTAFKEYLRKTAKRVTGASATFATEKKETTDEAKIKTEKNENKNKSKTVKLGEQIQAKPPKKVSELDRKVAEVWRVRNGYDSNICRRALRLHLELWKFALSDASAVLASRQMATPRVTLSSLMPHMSLSTFCVCFGLKSDISAIFPDHSRIDWNRPVGDIHIQDLKQQLGNPALLLADLLPLLSILCVRKMVTCDPPLSDDIVTRASTVALEPSSVTKYFNLRVNLELSVEVGSVLSKSKVRVDLAQRSISANETQLATHPSIIAANILNLWYNYWSRDLTDPHLPRSALKVGIVERNLRLKSESAVRILEASQRARQGGQYHSSSAAELYRMPKASKLDEADDYDSENSDKEFDFSQQGSREGYISNLIKKDVQENQDGLEGSTSTSISRKVIKLSEEEKEEAEKAALVRFPTTAQAIALSTLLRTHLSDVSKMLYVRPTNSAVEMTHASKRMIARDVKNNAMRSGKAFGKVVLRTALPAATVAKSILMTFAKSQFNMTLNKDHGEDGLYKLIKDLYGTSVRQNFIQWEEVVDSLRTCYTNLLRTDAQRHEAALPIDMNTIAGQRADAVSTHISPRADIFFKAYDATARQVSEIKSLFASTNAANEQNKTEQVDAAEELMRMVSTSDHSHYNPMVSQVAQTKVSDATLSNARNNLKFISNSKNSIGQRIVGGFGARRLTYGLPSEFGIDVLFDDDEAREDPGHNDQSGKATRKIAHALLNHVDQSSWTGDVCDLVSFSSQPFGNAQRYQNPLRIETDTTANEELWNYISKRPYDREDDEEDEGLPPSHVYVEPLPTSEAPTLEDDWIPRTTTVAVENLPDEHQTGFQEDIWKLPVSNLLGFQLSTNTTYPHIARNLFNPPSSNTRIVANNSKLFGTVLDGNDGNENHVLRVPAKGSLSVFRHLDGSPHTFMVNACLSKVFDLVLGRPGISLNALCKQVEEDTMQMFSRWHVASSINFLVRGQFISSSSTISHTSAQPSPFAYTHVDAGDECFHPTLHGKTQMKSDKVLYPIVH